jgi:hypothetical protein
MVYAGSWLSRLLGRIRGVNLTAFEKCWREIGEPFSGLWPGLDGTVKSVARDAYASATRNNTELLKAVLRNRNLQARYIEHGAEVLAHADADFERALSVFMGEV